MRWTIIILMSLSFACSKKDEAAPKPQQETEAEAPPAPLGPEEIDGPSPELPDELTGESPALGARPVVRLLDQGQEPRQTLRWNVKRGFKQAVSANVSSAIDALVVMLRVQAPRYVVSYDLTMKAKQVDEDGTVHVTFAVSSARPRLAATGKPERTEQLKVGARALTRVTGSYALGRRGAISNFQITSPSATTPIGDEMIDNLRWALIRLTPVFPPDPVGQGAKWTVHEGTEQGGIHVNQLTTIELAKAKGSRIELELRVQQSAAPQSFENIGTKRALDLLGLRGTASGSLAYNLNELAPRAADIEAKVFKTARQRPKDPSDNTVDFGVGTVRAVEVVDR